MKNEFITKKMIIVDSSIESTCKKEEFIICNLDGSKNFIGIETGVIYKRGRIVLTGTSFHAGIIMDKLRLKYTVGFFRTRKTRKLLTQYLYQVKSNKISHIVEFDLKGELIRTTYPC